jgi:YVTN family beta-propeller protein
MSTDGKLVWSVNPGADSVSVVRTDRNTVVKKIPVGNEPQGVALDPSNRYAYVANAADNSLTVIRITDARPGKFAASRDGRFGRRGAVVTGAEPWNVVASPDGKRVYVANSAQDTITVLDVATRKVVGDVNLRKGACNAEDGSRRFQPRGMAITGDSKKLYVTRFLSYVDPGGQQATDTGRSGVVCRLNITTGAKWARPSPSGSSSRPRSPASRSTTTATRPPTTPRPSRTSCRASSSTRARPTCRTSPPRPRGRCASTATPRRS